MFTAMLPGELASSAATIYDGIQTANFMYNVVIINADNALNPSAKMRIIYTTVYRKIQQISITKIQNKLWPQP
jgi:hypothetical protein